MKHALLILLAVVLLSVCAYVRVRWEVSHWCQCASRPVCEKSGGVCDCKYCQCSLACPGQCAEKCCNK